MKYINDDLLLYAVTDRQWLKGDTLANQVTKAIEGGVTCVQLREKDLNYDDFLISAIQIKDICKKHNVLFIINDNIDVAIKSGADGVHIGQSDMDVLTARKLVGDDMILGVSASNIELAVKAQNDGADYLGVGAVFPTSTKLDANDVLIETLKDICSNVSIPVVAIGGINKSNMTRLAKSGISGVALVSAIFDNDNIKHECKELKEIAFSLL